MKDKDLDQKKIDERKAKRKKEVEEILFKADENSTKGEQLAIGESGELKTEKEIKDFALGDLDNPKVKYETYYHGIQKLLKEHLPKGPSKKKARQYIYEEKNILINRGKKKNSLGIRGADGRMAFISDLEVALDIITEWLLQKGTYYELYQAFYKKNKKLGYHD